MESRFLVTNSQAKIRDASMTRVVHKDVLLAWHQQVVKQDSETTTHSLEVPVYHIARMEVVEALSDVGQLVAGVSVGQTQRERHLRAQAGRHRGAP
jgi:hypothetical protein